MTSPVRTAFDLARHLPLVEAIVAVDRALHQALVRHDDVGDHVAAHPTAKAQVRAALGESCVLFRAQPRLDR